MPDDFVEAVGVIDSQEKLNYFHQVSVAITNYLSNKLGKKDLCTRSRYTSLLVGAAIRSVRIEEVNEEVPALSKVALQQDKRIDVEILKRFVFLTQIQSQKNHNHTIPFK